MSEPWSDKRINERYGEIWFSMPEGKRFEDLIMRDVAREIRDDYEAELAKLRAENERLRALLESLTPGGSEFAGSPDRCVEWVRKRLSTLGKVAAERNRLRALLPPDAEVLAAIESAAHNNKIMGPRAINVREWLVKFDKMKSEERR